jgi:tetratricopeptide (TPR) repeat protein
LRTNSPRQTAQSQLNLASLHDRLHRSEDQIREAQEALAYFQPNRWVRETFSALLLIGRGEQYRYNFEPALDSFQRLLDESAKAGDRINIAFAQEGLGNVLSAQEKYPQAWQHYQEFLAFNADDLRGGYAALDCAITLVRLGRSSDALPLFTKAEEAAGRHAELLAALARYRAEMALSRNEWREAIGGTRKAMQQIANLNPRAEADLTRLLGLALVRSGDRRAGLEKCASAFAGAQKRNDPGELLDTRLALLEALLAARDPARAAGVFHDLEPAFEAHPESRWRALAMLARSGRQYADRAKAALGQVDTLWGHEAFLQYLKRPDMQELSRPLLPSDFAK